MKTITELRSIARRATSFEGGVEALLGAGVQSRGRAISVMRALADPRLYNEMTARKHPGVQHMATSGSAQTMRTHTGKPLFKFQRSA